MTGGKKTSIETIKNRRDFLAVAGKGRKCVTHSFILQCLKRPETHPVSGLSARVGYTVTKKMGNAVARNRIKRRLRESWKRIAPLYQQAGCDYVLIARNKAATCEFSELLRDMEFAFSRITANKNHP